MTSTTAANTTTQPTMMPPDESLSESEDNTMQQYENDIDVDDMMDQRQKQREERQQQKEERRQRRQVRRQLREERKNSERASVVIMEEEANINGSSNGISASNRQVMDEPPPPYSSSERSIVQQPNYGVGFVNDATDWMVMSEGRYRMDSAGHRDPSKSELHAKNVVANREGRGKLQDISNSDTTNRSAQLNTISARSWINATSGRLLGAHDEPKQHQKHQEDSMSSHNLERADEESVLESQREIFYDEDIDESGNNKNQLKDFSGMCVFILFVVGLTVGITCQAHGCSAKSGPASAATSAPAPFAVFATPGPTSAPVTQSPTQKPTLLIEGLPPVSLEALEDSTSAQSLAMRWMMEDPFLEEYSNKRRIQRFALATLYYATNGPTAWIDNTNWLRYGREQQECTWFSTKDNRVYPEYETEYNLYPCSPTFDYIFLTPWNNGMAGTIPPEVGLLTKLQVLDFTQGTIGGTLPSELGLLTDLRKVWLAALQLTGTLPATFFTAWSNLEGIGIYSTKLSGSIPTEIGLSTNLEIVEAYANDFSGPIPSEFGVLEQLSDVQIDNNRLSAAIPTELGMATALTALMVWENRLTGSVPSQLGQLSNLTRLLLSGNSLTSTIPAELMYGLGKLQGLLMAHNQLKGSVDDYYFASQELVLLHLEGNTDLVGTFPQTLCTLESGLQFNCNPGRLCGCNCACSNNRTVGNNGGGGGR